MSTVLVLVHGSISKVDSLKYATITLATVNCSIKRYQYNKCPIRNENNNETFTIICYVNDFTLPLKSNNLYLSVNPSFNCKVFADTATASIAERKEHCEAKLKRDDQNQCYTATFYRVFIRKATKGLVCFAIESNGILLIIPEAIFAVFDGSDPARRQSLNNQIINTAASRRPPRTKLLSTDHSVVTPIEFTQPTKPRATVTVKYLEDLNDFSVFIDNEITPILRKGPDYLIIELPNLEPGLKIITLNQDEKFGTITINYQSPVVTIFDCLASSYYVSSNILPDYNNNWVPDYTD
jgi:hypothetical protein